MELKPEQLHKFYEINKGCTEFESLTEDQKREVANGVANYYLTLFKIQQRNREKPYNISTILDT